jgi:hypothetical protein
MVVDRVIIDSVDTIPHQPTRTAPNKTSNVGCRQGVLTELNAQRIERSG